MAFKKIKGIIFDLDGTLADTLGDLTISMNEMLSHYGFPHRSSEELLKFINRGALSFVKSSLPSEVQSDDSFVESAFHIYNEAYMNHYLDTTYLYDGMYDTVTKLKSDGFKLAVFSNKQNIQTNAIVKKLFGDDMFDIVMGHAEFPHKPNPEAVFYILETLGITAEETIFVGDSDVDVKTAQNSGTYPVGVSWGYRPPEFLTAVGAKTIINKPAEIFDII